MTAQRALWVPLVFAALLSLPAAASDLGADCGTSLASSAISTGPSVPPTGLAEIFGAVPIRQLTSGTVECSYCDSFQNRLSLECGRRCARWGLCMDQCTADATTCELVSCICLPC